MKEWIQLINCFINHARNFSDTTAGCYYFSLDMGHFHASNLLDKRNTMKQWNCGCWETKTLNRGVSEWWCVNLMSILSRFFVRFLWEIISYISRRSLLHTAGVGRHRVIVFSPAGWMVDLSVCHCSSQSLVPLHLNF